MKTKTYTVGFAEIHYRKHKVKASSRADAVRLVMDGAGGKGKLEFWNHDDARGVYVEGEDGDENFSREDILKILGLKTRSK